MRKMGLKFWLGLFILIGLTQLALAENVIVLSHYGREYAFDNLADAMTCMAPGDAIDIQDFDGPLNTGLAADDDARPLFPTWITVKCSKPTPATIVCTKWYMGMADHSHFQNLILQAGEAPVYFGPPGNDPQGWSVYPVMFLMGGANCTFTDCTFTGFVQAGMRITDCNDTGPTRFTRCTFYGNKQCALKLDRENSPGKKPNPVILDHCTLVAGLYGAIYGDPTLEGTDYAPGSNLTVTNSILCANANGRSVVFETNSLNYLHHHNAYVPSPLLPAGILATHWWRRDDAPIGLGGQVDDWWKTGNGTPAGEGDLVVEGLDFRNPEAGDWRLADSPRNARLRGAGEDGTTIGAERGQARNH